MRLAAIVVVAICLGSAGDAAAQTSSACKFKTCSGGKPTPHDDNGYRFETSSIVYPMKNTGRVIYETCVENKSDRDFEIKWYIPGPDSWLLRGCALKSSRQKIKQETVNGYRSCLRYGNEWYPDRAEFVPHRSDLKDIADEQEKDCKQVIADETTSPRQRGSNTTPVNDKVEATDLRVPVIEELEAFAPFDRKEPTATMLHIVARVRLQPSEDLKTFTHEIRWNVGKAYESGPPYQGQLSASPENAFVRETYRLTSTATLPVNSERPTTAVFPMPDRPDLASVRYRLFAGDVPVASLLVPMWLPGP